MEPVQLFEGGHSLPFTITLVSLILIVHASIPSTVQALPHFPHLQRDLLAMFHKKKVARKDSFQFKAFRMHQKSKNERFIKRKGFSLSALITLFMEMQNLER